MVGVAVGQGAPVFLGRAAKDKDSFSCQAIEAALKNIDTAEAREYLETLERT